MKLSDFDYRLPVELIAQKPVKDRDKSRMILLKRESGEVRETLFSNFARYLREGDILVVNKSKVIPARIFGKRKTGGKVEIFLVRRISPRRWRALLKPARRLSEGETIRLKDKSHALKIGSRLDEREWEVFLPHNIEENRLIERFGHIPLPPYIKRDEKAMDRERYQTIFAQDEGSVAAPTAGLHFSDSVLRDIERGGITLVPLTLHVGTGTFRPLENEVVERNRLQAEFFKISTECWDEIRSAKKKGRRVVAVGTTTTRALESLAADELKNPRELIEEGERVISGWTELFIYPPYHFRVVDALLTNMHLPCSSLLILVSAFAGRERILNIYEWAIQRKFRFYSYGDVMFIS
jgi:S-adenosylmethionine:tRNA ribosyltransferase-isomerase